MTVIASGGPEIVELDREQSASKFDLDARRLMDMSGDQFVLRYQAGEFDELLDAGDVRVIHLEMLLPFWRAGKPTKP